MGKEKRLCSICGKGGKLTFEHVPPKATYNDQAHLKRLTLDGEWHHHPEPSRIRGAEDCRAMSL